MIYNSSSEINELWEINRDELKKNKESRDYSLLSS